jgi:hypothetical protein
VNGRRLVALYPAVWRARYEDEFLAVLEQRPLRPAQVIDIAWGAIDAHLFPQAPEGRYRMFTRISGFAGILAGLLILVGFGVNVGGLIDIDATTNAFRILGFYLLALIGLAGVHVRQVGVRPALAWTGFAAGIVALLLGVVSIGVSLAGEAPISQQTAGALGFVAGAILWIGFSVVGATMLAARVFPMPIGLAMTVASTMALVGLNLRHPDAGLEIISALAQIGIALYAVAWIGIGLSLVAAQPREGVLAAS